MDIISLLEAKKASKKVGNLPSLTTKAKTNTVAAINELDYLLGLLIPDSPPDLSTKTLSISGTTCWLSSNVVDRTDGHIPSANSSIKATRSLLPESLSLTSFGSGNSGSFSVELNGVEKGVRELSIGSDVGTFGELVISRNQDYPLSTPGFWEDLDAKYKAVSNLLTGYNEIQMKHSVSGNTNVAGFVVDIGSGNPTVASIGVAEKVGSIALSYSSGVPHYDTGSILTVTASIGNAITYVYGSTLAQILCGGLSTLSLSSANLGLVNPQNGDVITLDKEVTLNQTYFGVTAVTVKGLHPLATTVQANHTKNILVRIGTTTEGIGAGRRVTTANSDFPAEINTVTDFPSTSPAQAHDAKIVGGVLKHDKTNYADANTYMPVGVDYSSHNSSQYASFVFDAVNKPNLSINVTGAGGLFSNCWIKLPGLTGWLDTQGVYPGAGMPIADGAPCKDGGTTKASFHVTFGGNNTADCGNKILLRFKMSAGHSITNITIS